MKPEGSLLCSQGHETLSWAKWMQPTCLHPTSDIHFTLPATPVSSKWSFPSIFWLKFFLWISNLSHLCYMSYLTLPDFTLWEVQIMRLPTVQYSPAFCYFLPFRSKYSLQHPTHKFLQSMVFPQGETKCFTNIQNRYNYSHKCILIETKVSELNGSKYAQNLICS